MTTGRISPIRSREELGRFMTIVDLNGHLQEIELPDNDETAFFGADIGKLVCVNTFFNLKTAVAGEIVELGPERGIVLVPTDVKGVANRVIGDWAILFQNRCGYYKQKNFQAVFRLGNETDWLLKEDALLHEGTEGGEILMIFFERVEEDVPNPFPSRLRHYFLPDMIKRVSYRHRALHIVISPQGIVTTEVIDIDQTDERLTSLVKRVNGEPEFMLE